MTLHLPIPKTLAGRAAAIIVAALVLLLVLCQLFLPGIGEGAIEDRLTENGGSADVSLSAFPAARLLWGDGDEFKVRGTGLKLDLLEETDDVFDDLDRFSDVDVALSSINAGPIQISSFVLHRDGADADYSLESTGSTNVADLAHFGVDAVGLPGSGILDFVLGLAPGGDSDVPIDLDMKMQSDDGRIRVTEGGGTVAGVPTGPLAELLTAAIVVRL